MLARQAILTNDLDPGHGFSSSTSREGPKRSTSLRESTMPPNLPKAPLLKKSSSARTLRTQTRAIREVCFRYFPLVLHLTCPSLTNSRPDFVNHQADPNAVAKLSQQREFAEKWSSLDPSANVTVCASISEALARVRQVADKLEGDDTVQALITGSLHLVGGALSILEGSDAL